MVIILLLSVISNSYAYPLASANVANDIIDAVNDGIKSIVKAAIDVIKSLLSAVVGAIAYPFKLLANNFNYSSHWFNQTLGGFSPIGYVLVISLTIGIIFWFLDKYTDVFLG